MATQDPSDLPQYIFSTRSTLVAAWLTYAKHLPPATPFYDAQRRLFLFWDHAHRAKDIIDNLYLSDPSVSLFRFNKVFRRLQEEKRKADGKLAFQSGTHSHNRREVRRG